MEKIKVSLIHKRQFFGGLFLVLLGILMPKFFTIYNAGIYKACFDALSEAREIKLLEAALRLWALNTFRALPHYLGAFFLADSISISEKKFGTVLRCLLMGLIILLVYQIIERVYRIQYDIGVPAISMIMILFVLIHVDFNLVAPIKKSVVVLFLLCTFQCLDVMPLLSGYGFGRGETSQMIKEIADFLNMSDTLNIVSLFLMFLMLVNFILYVMLIRDENHIRHANLEKEIRGRELVEIRFKALQSRTYMEMEQLVHDLKTPLTSILTLVGVLKLTSSETKRDRYLTEIESSVERLSEQISEILDEERFATVTVSQFMNSLESQISHMSYGYLVTVDIKNPNRQLLVNQIRFSRMMINLIENAYYAVDAAQGAIRIGVCDSEKNGIPMVLFSVKDNGSGMSDDTIASVFETGFSTRGSSGLGLSFVKRVAESHGGLIEIQSVLGEGTLIQIWIPEGSEEDEE